MRKILAYIRQSAAALAIGGAIGSLLTLPVAVFALNIPAQFAPRYFLTQQTHYLRFAINFNSCVPVGLTCSFKVGSVPYNAFIVRAFTQPYSTFTGATTETVAFGTSSGSANIMAATSISPAGNAVTQTVAAGGLGTTVTGNGIAATGLDGGFDIWVTLTATVANPTAGAAVGIIEYISPNDGACTAVPLAATAPGC